MKSYSVPAAVLSAATLLCVGGVFSSLHHAHQAAAQLAADQQSTQAAQLDLLDVQRAAQVAGKKSEPANHFLETWNPRLAEQSNIEEILGRLDTLAVNNLLSPGDKTFKSKPNYLVNSRPLAVQDVDFAVTGDYARTLNWLGAVEAAFPLSRTEEITYTTTGTSLGLKVRMVFPRKFDAP